MSLETLLGFVKGLILGFVFLFIWQISGISLGVWWIVIFLAIISLTILLSIRAKETDTKSKLPNSGKYGKVLFWGILIVGIYLVLAYISPYIIAPYITPSVKLENKIYLASQTGPAKIDYYGDNLRLEIGNNIGMTEYVFKSKGPIPHWPEIKVIMNASQKGATFQFIAKDAGNDTTNVGNAMWDAYFSPITILTSQVGYGARYSLGDMAASISTKDMLNKEVEKIRTVYTEDNRHFNLEFIIKAPPNTVGELNNFSINIWK
jgi:hypothetical protein